MQKFTVFIFLYVPVVLRYHLHRLMSSVIEKNPDVILKTLASSWARVRLM